MYKANNNSWGIVAKTFHWGLAIFLISQMSLGINLHFMEFSLFKGTLINFHKIIGTTILLLVALRLGWRFYNSKPSNKEVPMFHRIVSGIIHVLLYLLILWLPIQGMLLTWIGGYDVVVLGLYTLPRLVGENFAFYEEFKGYHYTFTLILSATFLIHIIGGLYHRFLSEDKYGIWKRMSFKK